MTKKTIEQLYEELRQIIDGGSESFTHEDAVQYLKDKLAQPEQSCPECVFGVCHCKPLAQPEQERCVGCEACIDTACGRDECPKGWPKAAQPEQEPVAWIWKDMRGQKVVSLFETRFDSVPLYTTPPQRTWVGLTIEDKKEYIAQDFGGSRTDAMD